MKCKLDKNGECLNGRCPEFLFKCKIPCDYIVPMTNGDRIRAMSDEELAAFLASRYVEQNQLLLEKDGIVPTATQLKVMTETLYRTWWRWLQQSVEER